MLRLWTDSSSHPAPQHCQLLGLNPDPPATTKKSTQELMLELDRHRYHSMPSVQNGNVGLPGQTASVQIRSSGVGLFMMTIQLSSARPFPTARSQSHCTFASSLGNLCLGDPSVARAADSFKSVLTLKSPESLHHPCPCIRVPSKCFRYNPHRQP